MGNKYIVLRDRRFLVTGSGGEEVFFNQFIKLNHKVRFSGAGGTLASISQNALHVIFTADESANFPTVEYNTRVMFVDN